MTLENELNQIQRQKRQGLFEESDSQGDFEPEEE